MVELVVWIFTAATILVINLRLRSEPENNDRIGDGFMMIGFWTVYFLIALPRAIWAVL